MSLEKNIAAYIKESGINLTAMSRATGIPYMALYDSFLNEKRQRQLRGKELILVSMFLKIDPQNFVDDIDKKGA